MITLAKGLQSMVETGSALPIALDVRSPSWACRNCHGLGWVYVFKIEGGPFLSPAGVGSKYLADGPGGPGWYKGKLVSESCPACKDGRYRDWITSICGLTGADLTKTIGNFAVLPGKEEGRQAIADLLAMNKEPAGFITLRGGYGTGKSHLLKAAVNGFRMMEVVARYRTATDLLSDIRDRYGDNDPRAVSNAIEDYRTYRVLAVDEIDRVNLTGWAKETMFRILDSRFEERDSLATLIAHNDTLPVELEYLKSRMRGGLIITLGGDDMRPAVGVLERKEARWWDDRHADA